MKGKTKIEISITDDMGQFPITRKYIFDQDNTLETIGEWISTIRGLLLSVGFSEAIVDSYIELED